MRCPASLFVWRNSLQCRGGACAVRGRAEGPPPWRLARRARGVEAVQRHGLGFLPGETLCSVAAARALCGGGGPKAVPVASGALCARGGGCADVLLGLAFCLAKLFAVPRRRVRCAGAGRRPAPWRLTRRARGVEAAQMCCPAPLFAWRNFLRCRGGACAAALLIASRGRRGPRRGRRRTGARCRWRRPRCCRPCAPWRGSPGRQSASRRRERAPCSPRR